MDILEGSIRSDRLDIEFNQASLLSNKPKRVKLFKLATFPQRTQLWLSVPLSIGSEITNLTSIASIFYILPESIYTL